jgi:hypothetical protein
MNQLGLGAPLEATSASMIDASPSSPAHPCERPAFATGARPFQVRAVGEIASIALFSLDGGTCQPCAGTPGHELGALGPPIDLTNFPSAIYFGER